MKREKLFDYGRRCAAKVLVACVAGMAMGAGAAETESRRGHKEYDFHYDIRYPGRLRADVGRDTVIEPDAGDLKAYTRRVVEWWPKRGIDFTPLEDIPGAPLRTWTPRVPKETMTGALLDNFPTEPFDAHLVNFRGIGDQSLQDVNDPTSYRCPAAVLRFADGSKRVILAKYLSEDDRKYLLEVYLKDRKRMDRTLLQEEYEVAGGAKVYPEGVEHLYKLSGRVRFDTTHASIVVPAKAPLDGRSWVKEEKHEQVMQTIAYLKNQMENYWAYHEYAGALMRYWERPKLYKYYPIFGHGGGGGGGGYATCSLGGPGMEGVFHEWGHGMACGGLMYPGGGETAADALQIMADPANIHKAIHQVARPWKNLFHGQYPGGGGYEMMADDPNWGYAITAITSTLAAQQDKTPMHVYAHLGEERGLWKKGQGIRGVGDMFGQIGARFAEFDCQQEFQFRLFYGSPNRSYLMAVDVDKGLYRCPPAEAPEPFGVSISRLIPEVGAKKITVDFRGEFDPETYSDWRTCIVAVDRHGKCRYSPLWNKGEMSMDIKAGDQRFWLTVTATPKALLGTAEGDRKLQWSVYEAGFTFSYPYDVLLKGCRPGSAHGTLADNHNMALAAPADVEPALNAKDEFALDIPPRMNEEEAERFAAQLRRNIAYGEAASTQAAKTLASFGPEPTGWQNWYYKRKIGMTAVSANRARLYLGDIGGAPHPNGGGWVSATSHADPTAYVGPNCYVLGGARVLDHAQLIDGAVVSGTGAVVRDRAKLSGKAAVIGQVEVGGFARVYWRKVRRAQSDSDKVEKLVITDIPDRGRGRAPGFVANYDCLRPETVLLEDLLKMRREGPAMTGYHTRAGQLCYNGRLVGRPGFDAADGAGAYVFNGKDQYAELAPDVADLGEIVIAMRVRPARRGRGEQVLFEFGGDSDNRLMLKLAKDGSPVLSWSGAGKAGQLQADAKLEEDQWCELRIDLDGRTAAIYVDGSEAARVATDFRAADAFPPRLGRRNLVMRSREEGSPRFTKGQLDYIRIYSRAPDSGEDLPPVPLVSPTKATPAVLAELDAAFGMRPYRVRAFDELHQRSSNMDRARTWNDRLLLRQYTYELGSDAKTIAETTALRDRYYELEARLVVEQFRLYKEYVKTPEIVALQEKIDALAEESARVQKEELDLAAKALRKRYDETKQASAAGTEPEAPTPEQKAYREKLVAYDEAMQRLKEEQDQYARQAREIEQAVTAEVKQERAAVEDAIAELRSRVAEREKELSESSGPVAKVFAPVVAELKATVERLSAVEQRSPAEEDDLLAAKRDLSELIGHDGLRGRRHDTLVLYKERYKEPPTGLFYRDLELMAMRIELEHLERSVRAELADRLMGEEAYITAKAGEHRARDGNTHPPRPLPPDEADIPVTYHEAYRELPEFKKKADLDRHRGDAQGLLRGGFQTYANDRLAALRQELEAAQNALLARYEENAEATHHDEFFVAKHTLYKRRFFSILDRVSRAAGEQLAGEEAPDDLAQLQAASQIQGNWQTSTEDWNTHHREEEDFQNRNDRIKRWLKRIKPYRYGEGDVGNSTSGSQQVMSKVQGRERGQ